MPFLQFVARQKASRCPRLLGTVAMLGLCLVSPAFAGELVPVQLVAQEAPTFPGTSSSAAAPHIEPAVTIARAIPATKQSAIQPVTAIDEVSPVQLDAIAEYEAVQVEVASAEPAPYEPLLANATKMRMFNWREEDHYRAGCPEQLRHFTMLSTNNRYTGYQVGGGSPVIGTGPTIYEGTWGLDYEGFFPKKIALNWNRGRRYQGGTEGYKTDGPKHEE